jgi:hypothetical protein
MEVHLIDGTYELFRHFFAMPPGSDRDGNEVAAVRGVLGSILGLIEAGASHLASPPITSSNPFAIACMPDTRLRTAYRNR